VLERTVTAISKFRMDSVRNPRGFHWGDRAGIVFAETAESRRKVPLPRAHARVIRIPLSSTYPDPRMSTGGTTTICVLLIVRASTYEEPAAHAPQNALPW
jgi:hypothetical protein